MFDFAYTFSSYLDESFDMRKAGLFSVGGLIGQGPALFELERKWDRLCPRCDIDIAYFKASECNLGTGQFSKFASIERHPSPSERERLDEISCEFLNLIANEFVVGHGITVVQKDFYEIINDPIAKAVLGETPYRLAYDLAMIQCAWVMNDLEKKIRLEKQPWNRVLRPRVSFVCDEHEKYSPRATEAYLNLKETNPNAAKYMSSYTSADEKDFPVLQAADAIVYEVRRASRLDRGLGDGPWRKQFKLLEGNRRMALIQHANKDNLLKIAELHQPGEPFKLDEIMNTVFHADVKFKEYE